MIRVWCTFIETISVNQRRKRGHFLSAEMLMFEICNESHEYNIRTYRIEVKVDLREGRLCVLSLRINSIGRVLLPEDSHCRIVRLIAYLYQLVCRRCFASSVITCTRLIKISAPLYSPFPSSSSFFSFLLLSMFSFFPL